MILTRNHSAINIQIFQSHALLVNISPVVSAGTQSSFPLTMFFWYRWKIHIKASNRSGMLWIIDISSRMLLNDRFRLDIRWRNCMGYQLDFPVVWYAVQYYHSNRTGLGQQEFDSALVFLLRKNWRSKLHRCWEEKNNRKIWKILWFRVLCFPCACLLISLKQTETTMKI